MTSAPHGGEDHYELLGVSPRAAPKEIKRAYRRAVRKIHPDLNAGAGEPLQFSRVQQAYEVLSDPAEREHYDMLMGLGAHADHAAFHRHSFQRLFEGLFRGLRAALSSASNMPKEPRDERRKAG